jgi:hypothetical protein
MSEILQIDLDKAFPPPLEPQQMDQERTQNKQQISELQAEMIGSTIDTPYLMKKGFLRQILTISLLGSALMQSARADQGHMENALQALSNARYQLSQASHDKGGHRTNAIHIIDRAIAEVRKGMRVGASHGD